MMQKVVNVNMSQIKIAKKSELLQAILGSCVGIGLIWRERNICGLAHCLLPQSPKQTFSIGAKFVDQAVASLLVLMKIRASDYGQIKAVVAGGGNMSSANMDQPKRLVGAANLRSALQAVRHLGIKVVHSEGGDEAGRKIFVDAAQFTYRVERIPRI
jgi:chemotaxis protein CheD